MRPLFAALVLFSLSASASDKTCLVCHADRADFAKSVHNGKAGCADCHRGYDFSVHRAEPPADAPAAIDACGRCHQSQVEDVKASVHKAKGGPYCLDCHGEPHSIAVKTGLDRKRTFTAACAKCHENAKEEWADSVHGRLNAIGSEKAPTCYDCHGAHDIATSKKLVAAGGGSTQDKVEVCAQCHKGANVNFANTFTHEPIELRKAPNITLKLFSWLTASTITLLVLHILLDLFAWFRNRKHKEPPAPEGYVVRWDIHQRIQHWLMIASVTMLVVSDWPLRMPFFQPSGTWMAALGGRGVTAIIHRTSGVIMAAAALYHLVWLLVKIARREGSIIAMGMVPNLKDILDLYGNLAYFVGAQKHPPKFDRYTYAEKFEYWAVFWGVPIMFVTGLVRWFPVFFAKFLPGAVIESLQVAHGDEATLCVLAIFVWHMFNVHIKPSIFPMNWIWLDGKMDYATLRHEHRAEYERLVKETK